MSSVLTAPSDGPIDVKGLTMLPALAKEFLRVGKVRIRYGSSVVLATKAQRPSS
jgi:hypothetical protein